MSALDHLSDAERAELDQAVYASYGRMVLGAPPPEGSVTITATSREDFRRQFDALFPPDDGDGEEGADATSSADADPVRAPGPGGDPASGAG